MTDSDALVHVVGSEGGALGGDSRRRLERLRRTLDQEVNRVEADRHQNLHRTAPPIS
jgi:hypothetical protein